MIEFFYQSIIGQKWIRPSAPSALNPCSHGLGNRGILFCFGRIPVST
jgi:hypothetical protein